ncbi:MAG: hypothetical protein M3552_09475 [Planctomycetota bacterium]|nr:hypothetical protein [Planctomycetaceae bacterium]MDQ3330869.1 hypothetical protein [Planctomycetota bacterium]
MPIPALFAGDQLWYLVPLTLAVSLSYTASRYESREVILWRAASFFWKTLLFMSIIFAVLYVLAIGL